MPYEIEISCAYLSSGRSVGVHRSSSSTLPSPPSSPATAYFLPSAPVLWLLPPCRLRPLFCYEPEASNGCAVVHAEATLLFIAKIRG